MRCCSVRCPCVNGSEFTIVGVAPENFSGPDAFVNPDIYIPMHAYQQQVSLKLKF